MPVNLTFGIFVPMDIEVSFRWCQSASLAFSRIYETLIDSLRGHGTFLRFLIQFPRPKATQETLLSYLRCLEELSHCILLLNELPNFCSTPGSLFPDIKYTNINIKQDLPQYSRGARRTTLGINLPGSLEDSTLVSTEPSVPKKAV